jgi:hypothetical protein
MAAQPRIPGLIPNSKRHDGWSNLITGLGTSRDKRSGAAVTFRKLSYVECEEYWRGDAMGAKIIEEPAREMVRCWLDVLIENDEDDDVTETKKISEAVEKELKRLRARKQTREALMRKRAYGGSVILLGADDGVSDISKPLREATLRSIKFLTVFDAFEAYPRTYYLDPEDDKYGDPETYWIYPQGIPGGLMSGVKPTKIAGTTIVHESRVLRFDGVRVSRRQARENRGWGDSIFVRILETLENFGMSFGGAAHLMQDFAQAVFKMRGLREALAGKQSDLVRKRFELMDEARAVLRAVLLDAGDGSGGASEEFERKATPVTGLPEMLDRMSQRLAADADMPVTRLMGQAPGGFSKGDESGENWWYDRIAGLQKEDLEDPLERLVHLILISKEGPTDGVEPDNWSIAFRPLRQLTISEQADVRVKMSQADKNWVDAGVAMPEEIAVSRFGGDEFSIDVKIDKELRAKWAEVQPLEPPRPGGEPPPEDPADDEPADPKDPKAKEAAPPAPAKTKKGAKAKKP